MLLRDSKRASIFTYPALASAAVVLFLLRNRQITEGSSAGSGVTIAAAELLVRLSAILHAALSIGDQGLSLLLRVATVPVSFAFATLETELRVALGMIHGVGALAQHAALYLAHTF